MDRPNIKDYRELHNEGMIDDDHVEILLTYLDQLEAENAALRKEIDSILYGQVKCMMCGQQAETKDVLYRRNMEV